MNYYKLFAVKSLTGLIVACFALMFVLPVQGQASGRQEKEAEREFTVFFVNGIDNPPAEAAGSSAQLDATIRANFDDKYFVALLYNNTKGQAKDLASAAAKVAADIWTNFSNEIFARIKAEVIARSRTFNEKTVVVFVPHSEGNLYVCRLLEDAQVLQALSPYEIKVIAVASPIVHTSAQVRYIINPDDILNGIFEKEVNQKFGGVLPVESIDCEAALLLGANPNTIGACVEAAREYHQRMQSRRQWTQENVNVTRHKEVFRNPRLNPFNYPDRIEVHGFENYVNLPEFIAALEWAGFGKKDDVGEILKVLNKIMKAYEAYEEQHRKCTSSYFDWNPIYSEQAASVIPQLFKDISDIDDSSCPNDFRLAFSEWKIAYKKYCDFMVEYHLARAKSHREEEAGGDRDAIAHKRVEMYDKKKLEVHKIGDFFEKCDSALEKYNKSEGKKSVDERRYLHLGHCWLW